MTCLAPAARGTLARMERARRHQRILGLGAFGLLALVAELAGRSLTYRIDVGRHVEAPSYSSADYYPALLIAVKAGLALMLARLAWRFAKARATARAARRLAEALGGSHLSCAPRVRIELSPRLWLVSFAVTSSWEINLVWMPLFLAWIFKSLILRYGGRGGFHRGLGIFRVFEFDGSGLVHWRVGREGLHVHRLRCGRSASGATTGLNFKFFERCDA